MAKSTTKIAVSISSAMLALFAGAAAADYGDPCTIVGTPGADELLGTDGNDFICGLGGDDYIDFASAFAGTDTCLVDRRRGARAGDRVDQCESVR